MPEIFDNIDKSLLNHLKAKIKGAYRADFCVGYFNLRGWRLIEDKIEELTGGEGANCRLMVGMIRHPLEDFKRVVGLESNDRPITQAEGNELKKELIEKFRQQLLVGIPTNEDERGLQRLREQLAGEILSWGKEVYTLDAPANQHLLTIGGKYFNENKLTTPSKLTNRENV